MAPAGHQIWPWLRNQMFRFWTAAAVLIAYGFAFIDRPEILVWWKHMTTHAIERGCALLPYPWGDRIEATLGNFGLWVQITLAILLFRALVGGAMLLLRRRQRPQRSTRAVARNG